MNERRETGTSLSGAKFALAVPANWNGTTLLYSSGYSFDAELEPPLAGHDVTERELLERGYALVGSSYTTKGWAVEAALTDQIAALEAARAIIGRGEKTIAWGHSMGGLITAGIAQEHPDLIDAAVPLCASVAGAIPMLNQALDGAFVFGTLCMPRRELTYVRVVEDGRTRLDEARAMVDEARRSPAGRARVALAASIMQLPRWTVGFEAGFTRPFPPEPASIDIAAAQDLQASVFPYAAFSPRRELEDKAGGNFSWNTNIDYREQLHRSGLRDFVEASYAQAGLSLEADLETLAGAERYSADADAVHYMERNLTPTGVIGVPVLTVSLTGDFAPTVTQTSAYEAAVTAHGNAHLLKQAFVHSPGHCTFRTAEVTTAISIAEERARTGAWPLIDAANLNILESAPTRFIDIDPAPHVRPYRRAS